MRVGVIGGTGLYNIGHDAETLRVETPYGEAAVHVVERPDRDTPLYFLNRHGDRHATLPHRIEHRRNIDALARCKVDAVVAVNNTGGLRPGITTGHLVVPHDFVDLARRDGGSFFDGPDPVHVDLSEPYCPHVRKALTAAARAMDWPAEMFHGSGVYVATLGPRLETPAEVAHMASLGDVVGMTECPEAALARERGLCYASLCFVANPAAGLAGRMDAEAIRQALSARADDLTRLLSDALGRIPATRECTCREAPERGRLTPSQV